MFVIVYGWVCVRLVVVVGYGGVISFFLLRYGHHLGLQVRGRPQRQEWNRGRFF